MEFQVDFVQVAFSIVAILIAIAVIVFARLASAWRNSDDAKAHESELRALESLSKQLSQFILNAIQSLAMKPADLSEMETLSAELELKTGVYHDPRLLYVAKQAEAFVERRIFGGADIFSFDELIVTIEASYQQLKPLLDVQKSLQNDNRVTALVPVVVDESNVQL